MTSSQTPSPWFTPGTKRNPTARMRLFCFPFAGGSSHEFRTWGEQLPTMDVLGVLYPGRGPRYTTPLIDNIEEMVNALAHELTPYEDKPFAFFGHSLGGLISFELTRYLRRAGRPLPEMLIVSAVDAPHLLPILPLIHNLPHDEFLNAIRDFGGTPEAVLQHEELVAMMLPIMRADIKLLETYQYQTGAPLNIPLYALGGLTDPVVARQNLLDWEQQAGAGWQSQFFPGGHFYIRQNPKTNFFNYLARILN